ncbi:hypothetical protein DID77_00450 [Candidatus Marinamargulisbacteria bacterium SCGC AG-439-L15]|nr:hypothetical protein DID77_00450 [Candidatus Marinamargulisbacteria bacterium SCGC AG-439-L15]
MNNKILLIGFIILKYISYVIIFALLCWGLSKIGAKLLQLFYKYKLSQLSKIGTEPNFTELTSQMCTQNQMESPEYITLCKKYKIPINLHRKNWEHAYIVQALLKQGLLTEGKRGIGFGTGIERIVPIFASMGCKILATDLETKEAQKKGWTQTNQHSNSINVFEGQEICQKYDFKKQVSHRFVDMTNIDPDLKDFDFTWSACSLEHLGSLEKGLEFIMNSLNCLKPGGLAIHTTEYNPCFENFTIKKSKYTVLYRKKDLLELEKQVKQEGHEIFPFSFNTGKQHFDNYADIPPFGKKPHLKLLHHIFAATSFGIIIRKGKTSKLSE